MKNSSVLRKKIAGYSAIASIIIASHHDKADAQIVYHDIDPDAEVDSINSIYLLDLDNDGTYDFKFTYKATYLGLGAYSYAKVLPYNSNEILGYYDTPDFVMPLYGGVFISADPPYSTSYGWFDHQIAVFTYDPTHYGLEGFGNIQSSFTGIILKKADGNHYGWIRMTHHDLDPLTIEDYAYQSQPDVYILTGEYPTVVKNVDQPDLFNAFVHDNQLSIQLQQSHLPSRMSLINQAGMKVYEEVITRVESTIDVSRLAAGIYIVLVDDGEKKQSRKVMIQK